ncbi:hypothetical protein UMZ34_24130 [Halopseudomonas pachastrellae]|nr:hypothetical protein UMZ34_24130 [Halopseudomonas pachastrellae]
MIALILKLVRCSPMPIMALFAKEGDGKSFHDEKLVPTVLVNRPVAKLMDVSTAKKAATAGTTNHSLAASSNWLRPTRPVTSSRPARLALLR